MFIVSQELNKSRYKLITRNQESTIGFYLIRSIQLAAELAHVEVVVETFGGQEGFVAAALDDFAVIENQDLVGVADSAEAVGDNEAGAPLQQIVQSGLNLSLGAGVYTTGSLV
jgi:hypothetical protein